MDSSSVSTRWVWQAIFPTWETWWPESLGKYPTKCLSIERILRKELRCEVPVALSPNWNTNWAISFYAWMAMVLWLDVLHVKNHQKPITTVFDILGLATSFYLAWRFKACFSLNSRVSGLWSWKWGRILQYAIQAVWKPGRYWCWHTRVLREGMINW